jgi:hypothetical protein
MVKYVSEYKKLTCLSQSRSAGGAGFWRVSGGLPRLSRLPTSLFPIESGGGLALLFLPRASTAAGIHGHRSSAHPDKRANCDYNTDYASTNARPNAFCIAPKL